MNRYHRPSAKMVAPSIVATFYALIGALLLGEMGASGADNCPAYCSCNVFEDLKTVCALSHTNITVEWIVDSHVKIECNGNGQFTFEEFPQIDAGPKPIRLKLKSCSLPPSFELAASRVSARYIQELYIMYAPDDISADMVGGLEHLETLAIYGGWPNAPHQLVTLPTEVFGRLPNLTALIVNKANLSFRRGDFASAPALTYLELGNCNISRLPDAVFSTLNNLKTLYLWKNNIKELSSKQLQGLNSLQRLDIAHNQLRSLRGLAATHIPLQRLSASFNYFDELPPLTNLAKLQELKIFNNLVKPLKIAPRALASLPHLKTVDLSRNGIRHIPNDAFSNLPALKKLDLTNNYLSSLAPGVFSGLTSLEELELSHNLLRELDAKIFRSLQALQTLMLGYNLLTSLPPNGMADLSSLRYLSLMNNNLHYLTNSMILGASALIYVDFRYNNISDPQSDTTDLSEYEIKYESSLTPRQGDYAKWRC